MDLSAMLERRKKKKKKRKDQATEENTANWETRTENLLGEEVQIPRCASDEILRMDTVGVIHPVDGLGFTGEPSKKHKRKKREKSLRNMDGTTERNIETENSADIRCEVVEEFCDLVITSPATSQTDTAAINQKSSEHYQRKKKKKKKKKSSRHGDSDQDGRTVSSLELSEVIGNEAQELRDLRVTSPISQTDTAAVNQKSSKLYQKKKKKKRNSSRHENPNEDICTENSLELSEGIGNKVQDSCDSGITSSTSQLCSVTDDQELSELYQKKQKKRKKKKSARHRKSNQEVYTETSFDLSVEDELQELSDSGDILSAFQHDSENVDVNEECSERHKTKKKKKKKKNKKTHMLEDTEGFVSEGNVQEETEDVHVLRALNLESDKEEQHKHHAENNLDPSRSSGKFRSKSKKEMKKRKKQDVSLEEENSRKKRKTKSDTSDDLDELIRRVCSNVDSTKLKKNAQPKEMTITALDASGSSQLETGDKIQGLENIDRSGGASKEALQQVEAGKGEAENEMSDTCISNELHVGQAGCCGETSAGLGTIAQKENRMLDLDSSESRPHSTGIQGQSFNDKTLSEDMNVEDYSVFNTIRSRDYAKLKEEHERRGDNLYKFGRWSKLEKQRLEQNWEQFLKDYDLGEQDTDSLFRQYTKGSMTKEEKRKQKKFLEDTALYARLAKGLNRPMYSVYVESQQRFDKKKTKRMTKQEECQLRKLHDELEADWKKIAQIVERTPQRLKLWWEKSGEKAGR